MGKNIALSLSSPLLQKSENVITTLVDSAKTSICTKRLLTGKEAAEYLGITYKTILDWYHKGILKVVKIPGGNMKWDILELNRFIEESTSYSEVYLALNKITNEIK